jgi:hypothetical protein
MIPPLGGGTTGREAIILALAFRTKDYRAGGLAAYAWVGPPQTNAGKRSTTWAVNPAVYTKFGDRCAAEGARLDEQKRQMAEAWSRTGRVAE